MSNAQKNPKLRKATPEEKDAILALAREGHKPQDIGLQLNLPTNQVNGIINTARNSGKLPKLAPPSTILGGAPPAPAPSLPPEASMTAPQAVPAPAPLGAPASSYPGPSMETFSFKTVAMGQPGVGFQFPGQSIKYQIERLIPADGYLGSHSHPFDKETIGRLYGSGTYKITKYEPGKLPGVDDCVIIAPSFGPPKYPGMVERERNRFSGRPWSQERPDDRRPSMGEGHETEEIRIPPRNPYYLDPRMTEFARQTAQNESVAAAAINQMAELQKETLKQADANRKNGPDAWLQQFLITQQDMQHNQADDERRREERRQVDERKREDARHDTERVAWQRRQEEDDKRHARELEKIKAENDAQLRREEAQRKTLLDLEKSRLELIREEARSREEAIKTELQKTRESFEDSKEEMGTQLTAVETRVKSQMDQERDQLKREFDLRNKALDNEHALRQEMLKIREEMMQKGEGEAFTKMIEKLVSEVSKTAKEVVELKKIEMMSPEGQAALMSRAQVDGNIVQSQASQAAPKTKASPQAAPAAQAPEAEAPSAEGAQESQAETGDAEPSGVWSKDTEARMEEVIRAELQKPLLQNVIKEWALHVKEGSDPSAFANLFMEWVRDESDPPTRKACATFATFMKARDWEAMYKVLKPALSEEVQKTFEGPNAAEFYEGFRIMVSESIRAWFQAILEQARQREKEAAAR